MKRTFALLSVSLILALAAFAQTRMHKASNGCCTTCCQDKCGDSCCQGGCTSACCQGK
jgi:hypothetical protein